MELRVGRPDDDMQDDIAYTEVAFLNDQEDAYPHYDSEAPPTSAGDNASAEIDLVWPSVARVEDIVYLVGHDFALNRSGFSGASGIVSITFTSSIGSRTLTHDYDADGDIEGDFILQIGTNVIRCQIPLDLPVTPPDTIDVKVLFDGDSAGTGVTTTLDIK